MIDPTQDSPVIEAAVEADLPPLCDAVKVDGERSPEKVSGAVFE